jgi:hypothetical protein
MPPLADGAFCKRIHSDIDNDIVCVRHASSVETRDPG